ALRDCQQVRDLSALRIDDGQILASLHLEGATAARRNDIHIHGHHPSRLSWRKIASRNAGLRLKGQRHSSPTSRPLYCRASETDPWRAIIGLMLPASFTSRSRIDLRSFSYLPSARRRSNWSCGLKTIAGCVKRRAGLLAFG